MYLLSLTSPDKIQEIYRLQAENAVLKELISYGKIYVMWESTDCDHSYSEWVEEYESIENLKEEISRIGDWAEGRVSVTLLDRYENGEPMLP